MAQIVFILEWFFPGLDDIEPDCLMFDGPFYSQSEAERHIKKLPATAQNPRIHVLNPPR